MVNYRPRLVEEVKKHKVREILVKDIMLRVFTSFTEEMDINDASYTLVQKNISGGRWSLIMQTRRLVLQAVFRMARGGGSRSVFGGFRGSRFSG